MKVTSSSLPTNKVTADNKYLSLKKRLLLAHITIILVFFFFGCGLYIISNSHWK